MAGDDAQERHQDSESEQHIDDGEDLGRGSSRGQVTVADRGERDDGEVQGVEQAPIFQPPIEEGSADQQNRNQECESPELRVAQPATDGNQEGP